MYTSGMASYTIPEAGRKLGIPYETLNARMKSITKRTGRKWHILGHTRWVNEDELKLLATTPVRGGPSGKRTKGKSPVTTNTD